VAALAAAGFRPVSSKGSHLKLAGEVGGVRRIVIIPLHAGLAPGSLLSILRQSGLGREEFLARLKET